MGRAALRMFPVTVPCAKAIRFISLELPLLSYSFSSIASSVEKVNSKLQAPHRNLVTPGMKFEISVIRKRKG